MFDVNPLIALRRLIRASSCMCGLLLALPGCTFIAKDGPEGPDISSGAALTIPPPASGTPYVQIGMSASAPRHRRPLFFKLH